MALLFILLAAVLVWIARTRGHDAAGLWRATALAVGAYVLLVPTAMHPWYVLWVVPFLCANPSPAMLFFSAAVTLSYLQYVVEPQSMPWWAWLAEYGPLYALVAWEWRRGRFGQGAPAWQIAGRQAVGAGSPRTKDLTAR